MPLRPIALLGAFAAAALCADRDQAFLSEIAAQPPDRIQNELGISEEEAAAVIAVAREFRDQDQAVDAALRRAVFERRLARVAGEGEGAATEAQLVEARERLTGQIASGQMQEMRARLGVEKYQRVRDFIGARQEGQAFFPAPRGKAVPVTQRR